MSYQMEFRKLTTKFMEDVRILARRELMEGLQKLYVFRPKQEKTTRPGETRASAPPASVLASKPVPVRRPAVKLTHVPGGGRKCRVPECVKLSKGPRYDYFCAVHRTMSKAAKKAVKLRLAQPKNGNGKSASPPPVTVPRVRVKPKTAKVLIGNGPVKIEYDGLRLTREQWSRKLGLNKDAVRHRMRRGMSALKAITLGA